MRYVQLRAFHHVAIHGGFSRAAKALRLTQPAISDQVRRLEAEYDILLFDRKKKQIAITEDGRRLLEITHRLFEIEQRALEFLSESRALRTGTLKIIADSAHHMLHVLGPFREKYPKVFVSVRVGNTGAVIDALHSYDADIGVVGEVPSSSDYQSVRLSSTAIVAFASADSEAASKKSLTLKELSACPLVLREEGSRTRGKLEEYARQHGIKLTARIEAEGREAVREIVAAGGGVGVVSEAEFGKDSRLVKLPISDARIVMDEALLCLRERRDSKLIHAFMALAGDMAER